MNKIFTAILMALFCTATAQQKYISPVDFPLLLAGNVGEIRSGAFHAGIDIKGMKGLDSPVVAVADGYVWRVGVSPWGYGNVLYIKHKDGATSVYGHLHRFAPKIAAWVRSQQYARKSFSVDLYPTATQFVVRQGERIAGVGNSGSSFGAHLHLEIRDPQSGQPINTIKQGIYKIPDSERPVLKSISLYEIDTILGIEVHRLKATVSSLEQMKFTLRSTGYLVYEAVDYKDGKSNTMGVYSIDQRVNGAVNYSFAMDRIDFTKGKYVNTHVEYAAHRDSKFDMIRAYISPNNNLSIYRNVVNRGIIRATNQPIEVETTITDDAGNSTVAKIQIAKDNSICPPIEVAGRKAVSWNKAYGHTAQSFSVNIANGTLYQDELLEFSENDGTYTVGTPEVAINKPVTISALAPQGIDPSKAGLVIVGSNKSQVWVGGTFAQGRVTASVSRLGRYKVTQDITAPTITALNLGEKGGSTLRFKLSDNLSGISTYVLTIDGAWALAEYDGKTSTLTHQFKRSATPKNHNLVLTVTDAKNNRTTYNKILKW